MVHPGVMRYRSYNKIILAAYLSVFRRVRKNCEKWLLASSYLYFGPSSRNNSVSSGTIWIKFYIWAFLEKCVEKIQVSLKSDKNNG